MRLLTEAQVCPLPILEYHQWVKEAFVRDLKGATRDVWSQLGWVSRLLCGHDVRGWGTFFRRSETGMRGGVQVVRSPLTRRDHGAQAGLSGRTDTFAAGRSGAEFHPSFVLKARGSGSPFRGSFRVQSRPHKPGPAR